MASGLVAPDELTTLVDIDRYPLAGDSVGAARLRDWAHRQYRTEGICIFEGFLRDLGRRAILREVESSCTQAHSSNTWSTVYLKAGSPDLPSNHPRCLEHLTRVATLAEDQLTPGSLLRLLHGSPDFRDFVACIVGEPRLHAYADGLTSVNVLVFASGDELGWHFDESQFAVTLMLRSASSGGIFEYAAHIRSDGNENYAIVRSVLEGRHGTRAMNLAAGSLMIFRGDQSLHRVTPINDGSRIVAVLSYDEKPGVCLAENDRMLLYGRIA